MSADLKFSGKGRSFLGKVFLDEPNIGWREKKAVARCLDSNFVSTYGPLVSRFEKKFADYLGVPAAVSLQSGTAGLHLALKELNLQSGDEVIAPVTTFAASINPILYVGARPVLVDIDPATWNLDPQAAEEAVTSRTRAIMAVHLYGNPCNLEALRSLAARYNLALVEDATESFGSRYRGQFTGTFGDWGVFSFNGNKLITTGGGGMVVGRSLSGLRHISHLANQAKDPDGPFRHSEIGFNYRMTNLEASLGLAQLARVSGFIQTKNHLREIYKHAFRNVEEIQLQEPLEEAEPVWWLTGICLDLKKLGITVEQVQRRFREKGIPTRRIFRPLGDLPLYRKYRPAPTPKARYLFNCGISLPSSTLNRENDIRGVASSVKNFVTEQLSQKNWKGLPARKIFRSRPQGIDSGLVQQGITP